MAINDVVFQWTANYTNLTGWQNFPKAPSKWTKDVMQVVTESKRTVGKGALLHKDLLAEKYKYNLTWYMLTPAEYNALESIFRNHNFFGVRYVESSGYNDVAGTATIGGSNVGGYVTRVMYGGDMSGEVAMIDPNTGKIKFYLNVTWNLIER